MTATLPDLKQDLEARRGELLRRRKPEAIAIERHADPLDDITEFQIREQAAMDVTRDAALLVRIDTALEKIRRGTYGQCEDCEDPISPARLAVLPEAHLCKACAELAEVVR